MAMQKEKYLLVGALGSLLLYHIISQLIDDSILEVRQVLKYLTMFPHQQFNQERKSGLSNT